MNMLKQASMTELLKKDCIDAAAMVLYYGNRETQRKINKI